MNCIKRVNHRIENAKPMDISVIIVNYNTKNLLRNCLHSVFKTIKDISFEILVVDNASQDGSLAMLREEFPELRVINNSQNLGFAAANNQVLAIMKGRYAPLEHRHNFEGKSSVGPHYMTLNTADQSQGFLFADTIGLGLNVSISRGSAIDINYRFRHLSNAGIREPNYGIEHHIGLISCSLFY